MSKRILNMPRHNILAVSHDPGGARAILPVLNALVNEYNVAIVASGPAQNIFINAGFQIIDEEPNIELTQAQSIIKDYEPSLVLSSTSWQANIEQQIRNVAYAVQIPSVMVVDFWTKPLARWKDSRYDISELTDLICVMDRDFKNLLIELGFPEEALFISGQPHLEWLIQQKSVHKEVEMSRSFLFLSQSVEALKIDKDNHPLIRVIQSLESYAHTIEQSCELTIKLHPLEDVEYIKEILDRTPKSPLLSIEVVAGEKDLFKMFHAHDFVIGYWTMGLFEAKALGSNVMALDLVDMPKNVRTALVNNGINVVNEHKLHDFYELVQGWDQSQSMDTRHQGALAKILRLIKEELGLIENEESIFSG